VTRTDIANVAGHRNGKQKMTKYLMYVGIPIEVEAEDEDSAYAMARKQFFPDVVSYTTDELSVELVEEVEDESDD
jgi:hypothetical protein